MVVTIDGPAGAGKSTVARAVAERLGYRHVDTGEMYRELTAVALERGADLDDGPALAALVGMVPAEPVDLRSERISANVSAVSAKTMVPPASKKMVVSATERKCRRSCELPGPE